MYSKPTLSLALLASLLPVGALLGQGDVVINEIHYNDGPSNGGGEFLEIANHGASVADLGNWAVDEAVRFVFPAGTTLGPGEYIVLANNAVAARDSYGVSIFGEYMGRLANGGDTVVLKDAGLNVVDVVSYDDDPPWPSEADGAGPSLELRDTALDNSAASSWWLGQPHTPGAPNDPTEPGTVGDIVIGEILFKPRREEVREKFDFVTKGFYMEQGDDASGEYVEIVNVGAVSIDLAGWSFTDGIAFDFGDQTGVNVLAPGGSLVVAADPQILKLRNAIENVVGPFSLSLNDGGERVTLRDGDGALADTVAYNDNRPWPTASDQLGLSLEVIDPSVDNGTPANWRSSQTPLPDPGGEEPPISGVVGNGTPGKENSVAAVGLAPFVQDLEHAPARPTSADEVRITARVTAAASLALVEVEYSVKNSTDVTTAPLFDDGQHDDGEAGDGIYGGAIPAQQSQTLVHYRVRAADSAGRETVSPYDDEPSPTRAYFHYDHDVVTNLPLYFLFITSENESTLARDAFNPRYVNASLVIDGIAYPNIQVRLRGRHARSAPKRQWKFRFNRDELHKGNRVIDTLPNLPFTQWFAFQMFERAGIANLGHELIRIHKNGAFFECAIAFESPNSSWIGKGGYDPDSEVYKARTVGNPGHAKNSDLFRDDLLTDYDFWGSWNKKVRPLESPTHIRELTDALNDMPDEDLLPWLDQNVNVDEWLTRWALNNLMVIDDFAAHNYYLFLPGGPGGKWTMLGYDFDSLARGSPLPPLYGDTTFGAERWQWNKFYQRVSFNPTLKRIWTLKLQELLTGLWDLGEVFGFLDRHFERVTPDRTIDLQRWSGSWRASTNLTKPALSSERRLLVRWLTAENVPREAEVPLITPEGGATREPVEVTLSVPEGWAAVYTTDGSDPRLSATAEVAAGPFPLESSLTVRAAGLFVDGGAPDFGSGAWTDLAEATYEIEGGVVGPFIRGDFDNDGEVEPVSDSISLLRWLFQDGGAPPCVAATDLNGDARIQITDPVFLLFWAFRGGDEPSAPFPDCGTSDRAVDVGLGCEIASACE